MKALSLKQLGGAATEGTQGAAAEGLGHARAARKGAPRFGDALGQAVAKHTQRAVGGEAAGAPHAVEGGAEEPGADGRPANPRRTLSATTPPGASFTPDPEASAAGEGAAAGERSRRAPARKHPTTQESPVPAQGSPMAAARAAASLTPPRAPLVDPTARLASRAAAKGPLVAPSPAKALPAAGGAKEKAREREAPKAETAALIAAAREPLTPPVPATETRPASRTAAPQPAAPLPAPAAGHELQGGVLRSAAHLTLDAGTAGSLELHLRLRNGAVHLRVEGEGARAVEAHSGELSRALAGEGLKLAPIELGGADAGPRSGGEGGRGFEERRDAWQEAADTHHQPAAAPAPASRGEAVPQGGRGIHVEA